MPNEPLDLAFARHVRQIGLATPEQVEAAQKTQARRLKDGTPVAFSEILVDMGIITATQRETLEKKIRDQQAGIQQLGPYRLSRKLGEGGMGAVYLAQDAQGRSVAVKVLPRQLGSNSELVKRFRRETEAAARLKHPNIIGAFASGEDLGYHYYVMEYCDGTPLDKLLVAQKHLSPEQAITITLQIASGLKYAHDLGIIHRDIKPSNIILARDGEAKLLDLGLSKDLADAALSFKTVTGAVLGTPHYISPEQAQGERVVDGRSDIYSLGATLYHLVTGKTPFEGATALEILSKHVNTVLPNPQDVKDGIPDPVVHVLERMMAKQPSDRYSDCGALITDLIDVSQGRMPKSQGIAAALTTIAPRARRAPVRKRPVSPARATPRPGSRNLFLIGGGAVAAAAVVLAIVMSRGSDPAAPPPSVPPVRAGAPGNPGTEKSGTDADGWEKSVAALPAEAKLRSVQARLKALHPGYDAPEPEHQISHGRVLRLRLAHPALRDLGPLRALPELRELELVGTSVADLSPLRDSKLTLLVLDGGPVSDLRPLREMKELTIVSLTGLPLRDLSPLEGLELTRLTVKNCPVPDLSALRRVRLRELLCDFDPKRDTVVLRSMPALEQINETPVEEFWRKHRTAEAAGSAPPGGTDPLSVALAKLRQVNPEWGGRETHKVENGAVTELVIVALGITDLSPLSSLKSLRKLDVSGYWSHSEQKEYRSRLKDLSPLHGLALRELAAHHTYVDDLGALQGMPLEVLEMSSSDVRDLTPLQGMPLKYLNLSYTAVRSLAPLAELPLTDLKLEGDSLIGNYSPLQKLPLRFLTADLSPETHAPLIKSIRTLETLNGTSVPTFLRLAAPAVPPADAALWKTAIDLIPTVDPVRDAIAGGPWKKERGYIVCDGGENGVLRIPYEPPAEYDYRVVYLHSRGTCSTVQFLSREGRNFFWEMGGYGNVCSGFGLVAGKGSGDNATKNPLTLQNGQRYASLIEVRRNRVTAYLDGKKVAEWVPSMGELSSDGFWGVDRPGLLGLGSCESLTIFETVQVREVTGRGRLHTFTLTTPDPAFLATVAALPAGDQVRRVVEKLHELNLGYDPSLVRYRIEADRVAEFASPTFRLADAWPLRAFTSLKRLELGDERPGVLADIGFLKGMKLAELSLLNTRVTDLSPLQGMPLNRLQLAGSGVKDLSGLRGTKIAWLSIAGSSVLDLSPLKEVPLQKFDCDRSIAADYSPLKAIRTLKTVNDVPLSDFLKGLKEDWLPLFDGRSTDFLRNPTGWWVDRGTLCNDGSGTNSAQTRFEFENGDVKIRFETKGCDSVSFRVRQGERGSAGVFFDGAACKPLEGQPHELILSCRGASVSAALDGKPVALNNPPPAGSGCLQFNAAAGVLHVLSIEYRTAP